PAHLRPPPPFPPRRSSDLTSDAARAASSTSVIDTSVSLASAAAARVGRGPTQPTAIRASTIRSPRPPPPSWAPATRSAAATASRSEEHTSELQSPYDLVCR